MGRSWRSSGNTRVYILYTAQQGAAAKWQTHVPRHRHCLAKMLSPFCHRLRNLGGRCVRTILHEVIGRPDPHTDRPAECPVLLAYCAHAQTHAPSSSDAGPSY